MLKIKEIPNGSIIWKGYTILGIKGATLDEKWYEHDCNKVPGNNPLDYEIIEKGDE